MIRFKFHVTETTQHCCAGDVVKAAPVYSEEDGAENKKFWNSPPNGSLELACVNKGTLDALIPGQEFYLDLTPIT